MTKNFEDLYINNKLNVNYFKNRIVENKKVKKGETTLGLVVGCYFGSEKEGLKDVPKFKVAKIKINKDGLPYADFKDLISWKVDSCESKQLNSNLYSRKYNERL